jgi:hypothetical protein
LRAGFDIVPAGLFEEFPACGLKKRLPRAHPSARHRPMNADLLVVIPEEEDRAPRVEDWHPLA